MSSVYKCNDGGNDVIGRGTSRDYVPCANKGGVSPDSNIKWNPIKTPPSKENTGGEIKPSPSDTPNTAFKKKDERFIMKYKWPLLIVAGVGVFFLGKQLKWF